MPQNPYAVSPDSGSLDSGHPQSNSANLLFSDGQTAPNVDAVVIRQTYLRHESAVAGLWILYCLGGLLIVILGGIYITLGFGLESAMLGANATVRPDSPSPQVLGWIISAMGALAILFGLFQIWVGTLLGRLSSYSRILGSIVAGFWMMSFPFGTAIGGYIMYLLNCSKAEMVFSPYYHEVILKTPQLRRHISVFNWCLLGLFCFSLALFLFIFVLAIINR